MLKFLFAILILIPTMSNAAWFDDYIEAGRVDEITGLKMPAGWYLEEGVEFVAPLQMADLPSAYDLRDDHPLGRLQPIRNQRSCGSCWAFSVIAAVESAYAIAHPLEDYLDLAEQELVSSCSGTGGSCSGGYFRALDYVKKPGLPLEVDHPYLAKNSKCKSGIEKTPRIVSWKYLGSRDKGAYRGPTIEEIKNAIYVNKQEVSVTVAAFSWKGDGIKTSCNTNGTNHMTNLTGWHDFEDEADVKKYGSKGYWIMRNSWGTSFGDNGYAKVLYTNKYGKKCNNLGQVAAVVEVE